MTQKNTNLNNNATMNMKETAYVIHLQERDCTYRAAEERVSFDYHNKWIVELEAAWSIYRIYLGNYAEKKLYLTIDRKVFNPSMMELIDIIINDLDKKTDEEIEQETGLERMYFDDEDLDNDFDEDDFDDEYEDDDEAVYLHEVEESFIDEFLADRDCFRPEMETFSLVFRGWLVSIEFQEDVWMAYVGNHSTRRLISVVDRATATPTLSNYIDILVNALNEFSDEEISERFQLNIEPANDEEAKKFDEKYFHMEPECPIIGILARQ